MSVGSLSAASGLQEAVCSAPATGVYPRNQHGRRSISRIPKPAATAEAAPRAPWRDATLSRPRVIL